MKNWEKYALLIFTDNQLTLGDAVQFLTCYVWRLHSMNKVTFLFGHNNKNNVVGHICLSKHWFKHAHQR